MPADISGFDFANSVIRNPFNVFVIPTFQRPYAWDDVQIGELLGDLTGMRALRPPMHYLSPVHVARLSEDVELWKLYTDEKNNPDLQALADNRFRDDAKNPLNIYLVIDGQQRLTTLFALYARFTTQLTVTVQGRDVSRLLLNSLADH
jgi:Protein of unknown function DUF262